jgi:nucleotide-binding universal stress UspA family protein
MVEAESVTPSREAFMFSTMVVGVDGREGGRDALALAQSLGGPKARLVLVNAYPYAPLPSRASSAAYDVALREATVKLLEDERERAGVDGDVKAIPDTSPVRALHRCAERERADLIVVGSSHHGPLGRVIAGDVATGTLHGAGCPVVVAPRGYGPREPVGRIGVGYDGSPESERALEFADALARETGAQLRVVVVVSDEVPVATGYAYGFAWGDVTPDFRRLAEEQLSGVLERTGARATGDVKVGPPARKLETLSDDVELLVVGSRGFGRVRGVMLGSTSHRLVHHAHCPVLVIPRGVADVEDEGEDIGENEAKPVAGVTVD